MVLRFKISLFLLVASLVVVSIPASMAFADGDAGATVQERFAPKVGRYYAHAAGTVPLRNDFYTSLGYGLDGGYYFSESWGLELRLINFHSSLGQAGRQVQEEHGLVPDLRAPDALFALGARYSAGYGKILSLDRFVIHFDPQIIFHGGIALAEDRVVPTTMLGVGFLTHWSRGIQFKMDLAFSFQMERRDRGWTPSFGFVPLIGIGWSPGWGGAR